MVAEKKLIRDSARAAFDEPITCGHRVGGFSVNAKSKVTKLFGTLTERIGNGTCAPHPGVLEFMLTA